ncbi:Myeloid protein 1 p33 [Takifugu flavidus]|uniref:Myeloid protein 1 p33 n=1 Tax=Takifugu flavidus TaxID=433684 RepID=A0A5C6P6T5_9TELE|nr:Myeloid protein 1 p33 [Takifugu flavidus]
MDPEDTKALHEALTSQGQVSPSAVQMLLGGNDQHRTVDLACDHNSVVKAPFSGSLAGPVSHSHSDGSHHHGVTLLNDEHCVHIFNIQALRSTGPVTQGEPLGQLAPLQEAFQDTSPHLKLQMCDGSDPSPFLGL